MLVTVTRVTPAPGSTVWEGRGEAEDGSTVIFAGDWRPMAEIHSALRDGIPVEVDVEGYQVLDRWGFGGSAAARAERGY